MKGRVTAELENYSLHFDENGNINGSIEVNSVRPYLGIGFGRMIPKHRFGVRFEMECHVQGKVKVMQNNKQILVNTHDSKYAEELSKILDKAVIYSVFKLSLTGRIL